MDDRSAHTAAGIHNMILPFDFSGSHGGFHHPHHGAGMDFRVREPFVWLGALAGFEQSEMNMIAVPSSEIQPAGFRIVIAHNLFAMLGKGFPDCAVKHLPAPFCSRLAQVYQGIPHEFRIVPKIFIKIF